MERDPLTKKAPKEGAKMLVKIQTGVGTPGKLWTGSSPLFDLDEQLADVELVENWSESGASTRRLFGHAAELSAEQAEALIIPTLFVASGGVGSISEGHEAFAVWNWSRRVGGFTILNPVMVHNSTTYRIEKDPLPVRREGFVWIRTYYGSTLLEHVLVRVDEDGQVDARHLLPCVRWHRATMSPPERRAAALEQHGDVLLTTADCSSQDEQSVELFRDRVLLGRESISLRELIAEAGDDPYVQEVVERQLRQLA